MILTAFLIGLALSLVGLFVVGVRGFALWRQGKRTGKLFSSELELFDERAARTERFLPTRIGRIRTCRPQQNAFVSRGRSSPFCRG